MNVYVPAKPGDTPGTIVPGEGDRPLPLSLRRTADEYRRRMTTAIHDDRVLYITDQYWGALGDDAIHASAARLGVVARRYPQPIIEPPSRAEPNRTDRRRAARRRGNP